MAVGRRDRKGGCSRDHWEGKSEIQRKEKERKPGAYERKNGGVFRKEGRMRKRKRRGTEEFSLRVLRERVLVELQQEAKNRGA